MAIPSTATEHRDVLTEAPAIDAAGGFGYLEAIGELSRVLDSLFDGSGNPAYIGASRTTDELFYEHLPPYGTFRMFTRQFWGSGGAASIVAAVCVSGGRPVLMSIVAVGLPLPNAGYPNALTYLQAEAKALELARKRSVDI
jgi:hypothetical protein